MYKEIIDFWFKELEPKQWWQKDAAFDSMIQTRFGECHNQAKASELFHWRETALGCLAEIIVLDQFSRNMFRDTPLEVILVNARSEEAPETAQAIAQVCELTWQLRGEAGGRQVENAAVGLSINYGMFGHGSSVIVKV